jgi:hypothetical protein
MCCLPSPKERKPSYRTTMMRETIQMNLPATRGITTADSACGISYYIYIYKYMMVCEANENIKKNLCRLSYDLEPF